MVKGVDGGGRPFRGRQGEKRRQVSRFLLTDNRSPRLSDLFQERRRSDEVGERNI